MADRNDRSDSLPTQTKAPPNDRGEQRPTKAKPIPGDETDDEAKIEEFGERGLGVAAKE